MNYITTQSELGSYHQKWQAILATWRHTGIHWTFTLHTFQILKKKKREEIHLHVDNFLHKLEQRKFLQSYLVKKFRGRGRGRGKCLLIISDEFVKWRIKNKNKIKLTIFTSRGLAYTNTEWTHAVNKVKALQMFILVYIFFTSTLGLSTNTMHFLVFKSPSCHKSLNQWEWPRTIKTKK